MLVADLSAQTVRNESTKNYGASNEAFASGTLSYLPTEEGQGILISLMAEKSYIDQPNPDGADWKGIEVGGRPRAHWYITKLVDTRLQASFEHVMIYDIESRTWYNQSTKPWEICKPSEGLCGGDTCVCSLPGRLFGNCD